MNMAATIADDMLQVREQVLALCGFTEEELNEMQWNAALKCLSTVLETDVYGCYELPKQPAFWAWWREQWFRRDEKFLESMNYCPETQRYSCQMPGTDSRAYLSTQHQHKQVYMHFHRIAVNNPLVNNEGLEVSFHHLIKKVAKKETI